MKTDFEYEEMSTSEKKNLITSIKKWLKHGLQPKMKTLMDIYLGSMRNIVSNLILDVGDISATDGKSVVVSVHEKEACVMDKTEIAKVVKFKVYHEASHVLFSNDIEYKEAIRIIAEEIDDYAKKNNLIFPSELLVNISADLMNAIEDGRIENILVTIYPGVQKHRRWYRLMDWDSYTMDEKTNQIIDLRNSIFYIATIGVLPKGFTVKYPTSGNFCKFVLSLAEDISNFVTSNTIKDSYPYVRSLAKKIAPYFAEAYGLTEEEYEELLKNHKNSKYSEEELRELAKKVAEESRNHKDRQPMPGAPMPQNGPIVSVLTDDDEPQQGTSTEGQKPDVVVDLRKNPPKSENTEPNNNEDNPYYYRPEDLEDEQNSSDEENSGSNQQSGSSKENDSKENQEESSNENGNSSENASDNSNNQGGSNGKQAESNEESNSNEGSKSSNSSDKEENMEESGNTGASNKEDIENNQESSSSKGSSEDNSEDGSSKAKSEHTNALDSKDSESENSKSSSSSSESSQEGSKNSQSMDESSSSEKSDSNISESSDNLHQREEIENDGYVLPSPQTMEALIKSELGAVNEELESETLSEVRRANKEEETWEKKSEVTSPLPLSKDDILDLDKEFNSGYRDSVNLVDYRKNSNYNANCPSDITTRGHRLATKIDKIIKGKSTPARKDCRTGLVDTTNLGKFISGQTDFYKQEAVNKPIDIACMVLKDDSGSMNGMNESKAIEVLAELEECFKKLKSIKLRMQAFSTMGGECMKVIKDFDDDDKSKSYTYSFHRQSSPSGSNNDAFSIALATDILAKRKEKDKLLIIVSDGAPCCDTELVKKAVVRARSMGIFVISILIGSKGDIESNWNTFQSMYERNLLAGSLDTMGDSLFKFIKNFVAGL